MHGITSRPVHFEFVPYGTEAPPDLAGSGRVFLDVGGDFRTGVLDHHQFLLFQGSATRLVSLHPELVQGAVAGGAGVPVTLVLHDDPDLDCVAASYLALKALDGGIPDGVEALACYVDLVDRGVLGCQADHPFSLYGALGQIKSLMAAREWDSPAQAGSEVVRQGLLVIDYVLRRCVADGVSIEDVDAFRCPGVLGHRDRKDVQGDLDRYRAKLSAPVSKARSIRLKVPRPTGGCDEVDALLARHVQDEEDPDRVLFFKDWARTDPFSPGGRGYAVLSVYTAATGRRGPRCIVSVPPDRNLYLRGLWTLLEKAETDERVRIHGVDDRCVDPGTRTPRKPRPGYPNADPWYDGRGHGYTILDSPAGGTVLDADRIEAILLEFGKGCGADVRPATIPSPSWEMPQAPVERAQRRAWEADLQAQVQTLQMLVRGLASAGEGEALPGSPDPARDVFISYPRKRMDWVRPELFERLVARMGDQQVYMDLRELHAGLGWIPSLAKAIEGCRVFVPVFCQEYVGSPWCMWEFQLALQGFIPKHRPAIVPLLLDPDVVLPNYLGHHHALDVRLEGWWDRFERELRGGDPSPQGLSGR